MKSLTKRLLTKEESVDCDELLFSLLEVMLISLKESL